MREGTNTSTNTSTNTGADTVIVGARRTIGLDPPQTDRPGPWRGAAEWHVEGGWATCWRLRSELDLRDALRKAAQSGTGVRAEIVTDARWLTMAIRVDGTDRPVVDVLADGELVHRVRLPQGRTEVSTALPGNSSTVELWLPHDGRVEIGQLRLFDASEVSYERPRRRHWATYGSSITHCLASPGPSQTWPALVARRNGWDLTCLGFNGQALLDLPVAHTIAAAAPELVTLCVGINIFNQATMTAEQLRARLSEFVAIVQSGGHHRKLAVISPISSPSRERTPNRVGMTLADVRGVVAATVADLGSGVSYLAGPQILGLRDSALLSDGLHPDAAGYRLMADRFTPVLEAWARD